MAKLSISYDEDTDQAEIEGQKYSGDFFRTMGVNGPPVGTLLRITKRETELVNGIGSNITLEVVPQ